MYLPGCVALRSLTKVASTSAEHFGPSNSLRGRLSILTLQKAAVAEPCMYKGTCGIQAHAVELAVGSWLQG